MAERYIPEHRRTQFKAKNTFKPDELRRRREEQQVEIRKAKREENLAKRRGIGTGDNRPGASLGAAPDSEDENPPTESQVCQHQHSSNIVALVSPLLLLSCTFSYQLQEPTLVLVVLLLCAVSPALFSIALATGPPPLISNESVFEQGGAHQQQATTHALGPRLRPTTNVLISTRPAPREHWLVHHYNIPLQPPKSK